MLTLPAEIQFVGALLQILYALSYKSLAFRFQFYVHVCRYTGSSLQ